jgi:type II secretory pathway component PulL
MAAYRQEHPDDLPGIERRQRQVSRAWQAYRLLSEIEQQLGLLVALPVLGPVPQLPDEGEH